MNENIKKYWEIIKQSFWRVISRIEESTLFEKWVHTFESFEPRQQKWIRFLGKSILIAGLCIFVFKPLWQTWNERKQLQAYRKLLLDVSQFTYKIQELKRGFQRPVGWQNMAVGGAEQMQEGLSQYLTNMGVSPEFFRIENQGNGFNLEIDELSIKQAETLLFQIEGLYPLTNLQQLQIKINPENKTLLKLAGFIKIQSDRLNEINQGGFNAMPSHDFDGEDDGDLPSPPQMPNRGSTNFNMGQGGAPNMGDSNPGVPNPNYELPPNMGNPDNEGLPSANRPDGEEYYPPEFTPPPEYIEEE